MTRSRFPFPTPLQHLITPALVTLLIGIAIGGCGSNDRKPGTTPDTSHSRAAAVKGADSSHPAVALPEGAAPIDSTVKFTLKLAPHVGDEYSYRVAQKGFTEFEGKKATESSVYCFTQKITGINNDGSFTTEMRYDSIASNKAIPAGVLDSVAHTFAFDTRRKVDSSIPDAAQAKALIGMRVILTISKDGEVREVANLDPVLSALLGKLRDSVPPEKLEQVRNMLKISAFQSVVQQLFIQVYPDSAIHTGSHWSRQDETPLVLPIAAVPSRASVTYTLTEARKAGDRTFAHVKVTLATTFPQKKMDNKQVTTVINDAKATGAGDIVVDAGTGFPEQKTSNVTLYLKVTGTAKVGPAAGKSQTLSQTKSSSTIVELLNYRPAAH
ncbi:MAG TPA: DUF6263 family protein [Candidatus Kapabacteria bacterium]|nr:DUF6263 family protein [Candidatus Kapabacteria bacterium]